MSDTSHATTIATALNAGRIAYGLAAVIAPSTAARGWIGRSASDPSVAPMIRAFGIRDVALGAATIGAVKGAGPTGMGTRILLGLGVLVDVVDTISGAISKDDVPSAVSIYAVAGGAAAAGAVALVDAVRTSPDQQLGG